MKNLILMTCLVFVAGIQASAQKSEVFQTPEGAIHGYDPVAYFTQSKAVKGNDKFMYKWDGANWMFANQQNLETFKANPGKYAPQYGGYCAYGTSQGHKAPTEANAWTIVDGKLYMNYNNDVKKLWSKDRPGFIKKADKNWSEIKDKE